MVKHPLALAEPINAGTTATGSKHAIASPTQPDLADIALRMRAATGTLPDCLSGAIHDAEWIEPGASSRERSMLPLPLPVQPARGSMIVDSTVYAAMKDAWLEMNLAPP